MHDRPIARPIDDSVVGRAAGGPVLLRRARGFALAPFALPPDTEAPAPLLCVGGQMENAIAVAAGRRLLLSPQVGDLSHPAAVAAFRRAVDLLGSLHQTEFAAVVCDAHPDYVSTHYAESLGLPVVRVQHHLAHLLACLLEHGGGPKRMLGVAWDGTGYGPDGTVWDGEFIVVDRERRSATRVAHLRPFRLPGGEAAVREPRRCALGLWHELSDGTPAQLAPLAVRLGFKPQETALLEAILWRGLQSPVTTSAGRLFDGIAALLGLRQKMTFEGQAAMEVEFAAEQVTTADPWHLPVTAIGSGQGWQVDWRPAVAAVLDPTHSGNPARAAARFHASLAQAIAEVAQRAGVPTVVLTGGCFQNVQLLELTTERLQSQGHTVLQHRDLPPNDGAIAAGQALAALWGITTVASRSD